MGSSETISPTPHINTHIPLWCRFFFVYARNPNKKGFDSSRRDPTAKFICYGVATHKQEDEKKTNKTNRIYENFAREIKRKGKQNLINMNHRKARGTTYST